MPRFHPTLVTVKPALVTDSARGPLVSLTALWTMSSGEQYEVCVPLLSHYAAASLTVLLCGGDVGPLALLALAQPI
jgi:hypothetical protein